MTDSLAETPKPKKRREPLWQAIFVMVAMLTAVKWALVFFQTQEIANGYLLAVLAWTVCAIQSRYLKLPSETPSPVTTPEKEINNIDSTPIP